MNLSELFIRRPIATSLLMAAIALFGIVAYRTLHVSDLPNIDYPTINVQAGLAGADPSTMASSVATVLERQFTTISGLDSMTSSSSLGSVQITLQFDLARDIDSAATDVQTAIAEATPLLPAGMPSPPRYSKGNNNDNASQTMQLVLVSDTQSMQVLDDLAQTVIAPRISMINGVAQVQVNGSQKYAVRIQLNPDKLVAKRIGLNEITAAIDNWNANIPTGTLFGPQSTFTVTANGQLNNAREFGNMVVAYRANAPVRLGEVADVLDSVEDNKQASFFYTKDGVAKAIQMGVNRQAGANSIDINDQIYKLIPGIESQLPPSVHLMVRGDRTRDVRKGFQDIQVTMVVTLVLVVLVIFLFLQNAWATIIPSFALPFSLLGTFAVMALLNYTLDNLSLMALILSIGFVVDDAIVMLENIIRHIELGEKPMEAALKGSREVGFTILSMTVSLAAVFIPIMFLAGILGRLFREFAVTITAAILISGLVSISFTPMLCSRFLKAAQSHEKGRIARFFDWPYQQMFRFYRWTLTLVLRFRPLMLLSFFGVAWATYYYYGTVKKGFIPDADGDFMQVNIEAAQGESYYKILNYQRTIGELLRKEPNVEVFMIGIGGNNQGRINGQVQLKPRESRDLSVQQFIEKLRPRVSNYAGFKVYLNNPPAIRIGGRWGNSSYQVTVQAPDTDELYKQAAVLEKAMVQLPEIQDVSSDLLMRNPTQTVFIKRERAALYQIDPQQIQNALYSAYGPLQTSNIYTPISQYHVIMETRPDYQQYADSLSKMYFKAGNGQLVPLDSLAEVKPTVGPQSIAHSGQLPSVTLSFNLRQGVSLGDAVDKIHEIANRELPATVTTSFTGTARTFETSMVNLSTLLVVAILVVYIVLGALYESYIQPLTILSGLPSAGLGALLTLVVFKVDLNIYSFVGLIMLIGIVKKNAIMQVDFALEAERRGASPADAVLEGCLVRFRPIMMTTMAAFLGAVPMALGWGAGGEVRKPLGLAVAGGLLFSQLMTLYLTPVVYCYLSSLVHWVTGKRSVSKIDAGLDTGIGAVEGGPSSTPTAVTGD